MKISMPIVVIFALLSVNTASADLHKDVRKATTKLLKSGKYEEAFQEAHFVIVHKKDRPKKTDIARTISLFKEKYPDSLPYIAEYYQNRVSSISGKHEFSALVNELKKMESFGLMSVKDSERLQSDVIQLADKKNKTGEIYFLLTDPSLDHLQLDKGENEFIVFSRSVDYLETHRNHKKLIGKVFDLAKAKGKDSREYAYLKQQVAAIDLPIDIVKTEVSDLYPELAEELVQDREIVIFMVNDSSDEFFYYELDEKIRSDLSFRIVDEAEPGSFQLIVRNLKVVEKEIPERTKIIRYSYYQVDIMKAALLMPKHASYVFDEIAGGMKIRYSGILELSQNGVVADTQRISDSVEELYSYCDDARVINAFGGVEPADFIPNSDMQNRCSQTARSIDIDKINERVINEVLDMIKTLRPISEKIELIE